MSKVFALYNLITYSGMAAGVLLVITAGLGIGGFNVEVHEGFGIATLCVGGLHGGLIVYKNAKIRAMKKGNA